MQDRAEVRFELDFGGEKTSSQSSGSETGSKERGGGHYGGDHQAANQVHRMKEDFNRSHLRTFLAF